jgi:coproporphyrinogen III oxidase-like Fe-S oxidoreductase
LLGREAAVSAAVGAGWLAVDEARLRLTPTGVLFADELAARLWK